MLVVVGGGFAGLESAIQIRTLRPDCDVTLISPGPYLVYKPWLIYVPAGRRRLADVSLPLAPMAARHSFHLVQDRVRRVDVDLHQVHLAGGRAIDYSQLVLAVGAEADRDSVPGADEHALFPCDPEDAGRFASEIQRLKPRRICVAVGWDRRGPGLELAGWLAARRKRIGLPGLEVTVVDGDGRLDAQYGAEAMTAIRSAITRCGATLYADVGLDEVTESGAVIDGKTAAFDLVAIVSPLRGAISGLPAEMLDEAGFIRVDETFATGRPGIFAFGDAATLPAGVAGRKTMVSIRQRAGHLARNVIAQMEGEPLVSVEPSSGPHVSMSNIGGRAIVLQDNHVIGRGKMPLFSRWLYDQSYIRSRT